MSDDITEDDLYQAVAEYMAFKPSPGLEPRTTTAPKLAKERDITEAAARKILEEMAEAGTVKHDKVKYTDPWGGTQKVKGYRLAV